MAQDLADQILTTYAAPRLLRYATIRARGRDPGTEGQDETHPFHVHGPHASVGRREPFDAIEDAINYLHRNGYARLDRAEEKRWRVHMNGERTGDVGVGEGGGAGRATTMMPNLVIAVFGKEILPSPRSVEMAGAEAMLSSSSSSEVAASMEGGVDGGGGGGDPIPNQSNQETDDTLLTANNLTAAVINTATARAERLARLPQIATVNRGPGPDEWRFEYFVRGLVPNQIRGFKYIEDAINLVAEAGYMRMDVDEEEKWRRFIDYANYNGEPDDPFVKFAGNVPSVFAK